ncbi:MAG: flippase [Planctomycetota bacterium]
MSSALGTTRASNATPDRGPASGPDPVAGVAEGAGGGQASTSSTARARLQRNLRATGIGVFGTAVLQYALYFWIAQYFGSASYGEFALALTLALLSAPLCDLGMNVAVVWSHARVPEALPEVVGTSLVTRLSLVVPVTGIVALLAGVAGFGWTVLVCFVPLFLGAVLDGISGLFSAVYQAREQMGYSAAIMLARNVARVLAFAVCLLCGTDLLALSLALMAASAMTALGAGIGVWRRIGVRWSRQRVAPVIRDAAPFGLAIFGNLALMQSDVLMLGALAGPAATGVYHGCFRFLIVAELLPQAITMAVMPQFYRLGLERSTKLGLFYRSQAALLACAGVLGSALLATNADVLVALCLGEEYRSGGVILAIVAPLVFLRFLIVPIGDALAGVGQQRKLTEATWIALVVNVVTNCIVIPTYGAFGAAASTLLAQMVLFVLVATWASRQGVELGCGRWLRPPLIAVLAGAAVHTLDLPGGGYLSLATVGIALAVLVLRSRMEEHCLVRSFVQPGAGPT